MMNNGIKKTEMKVVENAGDAADGLLVMWSTSGLADYETIHDALSVEFGNDFADRWCPDKPSEKLCLRKAVMSLGKKTYNLDNLRKGDWAISLRERTEDNGVGVKYMPTLRVGIEDGEIKFSDQEHELVPVLQAKSEQIRRGIPSENIRAKVQEFFKRELDTVAMRAAGGVEYVRADNSELFEKYANCIAATTDTAFTVTDVVHGPNSIAALTKAVVAEAEREMQLCSDALLDDLGSRAYSNRRKAIVEQQEKLERYTSILGSSLDDAKAALEDCKVEVSAAVLASFSG